MLKPLEVLDERTMKSNTKNIPFIITLLFLVACQLTHAQPVNVIINHGNVWITDSNNTKLQLSFTGKDTMPVLSPDKKYVAFIRKINVPKNDVSNFDSSQIWLVNLKSDTTMLMVQSKVNSADSLSLLRGGFDALQFSPDSKYLYFLSMAWQASMAVHRIDMATKQGQFVCDGNSLYIIPTGKNAGDLIVLKHNYKSDGSSYERNWLLTPDGTEIKELPLDKKDIKAK